jgi:hypothetical protein
VITTTSVVAALGDMRHRHLPYKNAKIKGIPAATRRGRQGERRNPLDIVRIPSAPVAAIIFSNTVGTEEGAPLGSPLGEPLSLGAPLGAPLGILDGDAVGIGMRELNLLTVIGS